MTKSRFCGISAIFFQCCFMSETQILMAVSDFFAFFSRNHFLEGGFTFPWWEPLAVMGLFKIIMGHSPNAPPHYGKPCIQTISWVTYAKYYVFKSTSNNSEKCRFICMSSFYHVGLG